MEPITIGTIIFISITYCTLGAGTISLIRKIDGGELPKLFAIIWWLMLIFAAFGAFDNAEVK